jgi:hypothetical protein
VQGQVCGPLQQHGGVQVDLEVQHLYLDARSNKVVDGLRGGQRDGSPPLSGQF